MRVDDYQRVAGVAIEALARHVDRSQRGLGAVSSRLPTTQLRDELDLPGGLRGAGMDLDAFKAFLEAYLGHGVRLHHPGSLAHQVAVPDVPAALADLIHGALNQPMSIYEMGAAAATCERVAVEWMLEHVGFDPGAGDGVLTHGGSLANLTGLLAARAAADPDVWSEGTSRKLAILAPPSAHYSVMRAAGIMGLGERAIIPLEVDELERIRPEALEAALGRCRAAGRDPIALVAAACATSTGLYDDLGAIGSFCRANGLWFHVDAAHGAGALLSAEHRHLLDGIEQADSVVWDAHKMLRTTALCAGVLVRDGARLRDSFRQRASYLIYAEGNPDGMDVLDRQLECTKAELGLKLVLQLAWRGERALGEYVAEQYRKTLRFWELIRARPGFECRYRPQSNILCFRRGSDSDRQVAIRDRLLDEGDFHLSSTEVAGERYLRMTVMAPSTDEATIERLLGAIERIDRGG